MADLATADLSEILRRHSMPKRIDYLSFDVDEAMEPCLDVLPLGEYRFRLVHAEHNLYLPKYAGLKEKIAKKFIGAGYVMLVENVMLRGRGAVEDWFCAPGDFGDIWLSNIDHRNILSEMRL